MLEQQWYNRLGSARLGSARLGSARLGALLVTLALLAFSMLLAVPPAGAQTTDYDVDDDRLIEIRNLDQLNAIRHDPNGNGDATHADYVAAFPGRDTNAQTRMGCPSGMACQGYELTADLTFPETTGAYNPFTPIGTTSSRYETVFEGNGYTLNGPVTNAGRAGPFGVLGVNGVIRNLGVVNPDATTTGVSAGGLVGESWGTISKSYVRGGRVRANANSVRVGGLAGINRGTIRASYATATVGTISGGTNHYGGLVGQHRNAGSIIASYAAGAVSPTGAGAFTGGFIGQSREGNALTPTVTDSTWDTSATGQTSGIGNQQNTAITITGYTTGDLRRPTGYTAMYANWDIDTDGDTNPDDPWDFGGRRDYPLLKIDKDGDGTATWEEFGGQYRYIPPPPSPPPYNPAHDHPEIYQNARYEMATSCAVQTTGTGDEAISTSTLTFDLGDYTRPITLALSLWDGTHFRSLQSQGIAMPELRQEGQTATVEVVTDPAQTRFRLDSEYGLNLVLGYADCRTDDPVE